jgi:hypothetical protein
MSFSKDRLVSRPETIVLIFTQVNHIDKIKTNYYNTYCTLIAYSRFSLKRLRFYQNQERNKKTNLGKFIWPFSYAKR